METNGLSCGMFSGIGSGMLGLEMSLHPQQQQNPQSSQNPHHNLHHHQPQMVAFSHHETDQSQLQQSVKQGYSFGSKNKQQPSPLSDEDEPGDDGGDAKKISPWQRMKWTDSMVRLLIMAVYYIGDEGGSSEGNNDPTNGKKKGCGGGGLLQKKGKWKSVSRAMMEKGFYVSPQQCEDKFNDLNKRYKRVNDILGRGTACRVVENQSLLDTMDNLSPKLKEEVRKLLNSKHLFFREMCAYHNSCGHGASATAGASGAANHSPEVQLQHQQAQQQQLCLHSSDNAQIAGNQLGRIETEATKLAKFGSTEEEDDDDDDDSDDDSDGDEEEDDESRGQSGHGHGQEDGDEKCSRKRPRKAAAFAAMTSTLSPLIQQLSCEVVNVMQDGSKTAWEKKHWVKMRLMQLEEQQVNYRYQAYELEKERLKWVKFSVKKEREMEKAKLENERRRLENERMMMHVRQKELELVEIQYHHQHQQHSSNKRGDPSSITG